MQISVIEHNTINIFVWNQIHKWGGEYYRRISTIRDKCLHTNIIIRNKFLFKYIFNVFVAQKIVKTYMRKNGPFMISLSKAAFCVSRNPQCREYNKSEHLVAKTINY